MRKLFLPAIFAAMILTPLFTLDIETVHAQPEARVSASVLHVAGEVPTPFERGLAALTNFSLVPQAMAQEPTAPTLEPVPLEGDLLHNIVKLATDFKALGVIGSGMLLLVILLQGLKAFFPNFKYYRVASTVGAILYGVLAGLATGAPWYAVLVLVLLTKGGATDLYESLKGVGVIKKKATA